MIRTLIVEDEAASRSRLREILSSMQQLEVVGESGDGMSAVEAITTLRPDLVLLDVQLPGLDGFGVLEALPERGRPAVLFITAYDEFAIRAFDANAIDYVLKPYSTSRVTRAVNRAVERIQLEQREPAAPNSADDPARQHIDSPARRPALTRFVARSVNRTYFIPVADVEWIDVADNYLRLHVKGRSHLVRGTMSAAVERLDPEQCVRINRGLIVRIDAIAGIECIAPATYRVTMSDGSKLSSSRTYAHDLRRLMSD